MTSLAKNRVLWRYYLYRASNRPGFQYPIYILFLLANGLSFTQIGVIASIQAVVVVAGEVPAGYLGDRIGRRNSLAIASILFLVSNVGYLVVTDFVGFLFVFVFLSIGLTFVSGSDNAWLYDILAEYDAEGEFTHVSGRARAIGSGVQAVAMLSGGILYVVNPYYPFVAAVVLSVVNVVSAFSLPKNRTFQTSTGSTEEIANGGTERTATETSGEDNRLAVREAIPVVRTQLSKPAVYSFAMYIALFSGALMTADVYVQPIARDTLQASIGQTLAAWNVPEAATLGLLYASFTFVSAILSNYAGAIEDRFGTQTVLVLVPVGTAVLYLLPVVVPLLAFPMFFVMRGGKAVFSPISRRYLNDRITSGGRATVLSVVSMLQAIVEIPFRVGSGVVADQLTPLVAVSVLGLGFLASIVALFLGTSPIRPETA